MEEEKEVEDGRCRTKLRRIQNAPQVRHIRPIEPTALHPSPSRRTLARMQHATKSVARLEDVRQGRREHPRRGVNEGVKARHVFREEGRGHGGIEGFDGGAEGLTAPDGGDEGFAWGEDGSVGVWEGGRGGEGLTVEELLVQLGQLAVRLLRVRHEELVHDPFAQHLAHHMSKQALHDEPKPRVVEPSRVERLEERRLVRVLQVLIQCLGERDEGEVGAEFGAWRGRRGGSHLVAERVGGPAVDAALETARAVLYGELGEGRKGY